MDCTFLIVLSSENTRICRRDIFVEFLTERAALIINVLCFVNAHHVVIDRTVTVVFSLDAYVASSTVFVFGAALSQGGCVSAAART